MRAAAADLEFETAARLRDEITRLEALDLGLEPPPVASASCGRRRTARRSRWGRGVAATTRPRCAGAAAARSAGAVSVPVDPAVSRTALLAGALTPALQATAHALADAGFAVAAPSVEPRAHGIGPAGVLVINTVAADRADPDGADAIGADANGAGLGGAGDWREAAEPAARAFRLVERFAAQLGEGTRGVVVFILDQRSAAGGRVRDPRGGGARRPGRVDAAAGAGAGAPRSRQRRSAPGSGHAVSARQTAEPCRPRQCRRPRRCILARDRPRGGGAGGAGRC